MALGGVIIVAMLLSTASPACVRLERPLAAGDTPTPQDLSPAPCGEALAALVYDQASGLARARRDLAQGQILRAPPSAMLARVRKGQTLRLRALVGPVMIERQVVAVRAAPAGRPVWVRGEDGVAFAASAASVSP